MHLGIDIFQEPKKTLKTRFYTPIILKNDVRQTETLDFFGKNLGLEDISPIVFSFDGYDTYTKPDFDLEPPKVQRFNFL